MYNSGSSIGLTGTLTLDAGGDQNAVFIFQAGSTLTTASASTVSLINGAQPCNVYWQVGSSATIGTTTSFVGTILALTSITVNTSATIQGRALAQNGAVTLQANTITKMNCAAGSAGGATLPTTNTGSGGTNFAAVCPALSPQVIAPTIISSNRVSPTSVFISWGPNSGVNTFNVQYGPTNGNWLYNTDVTGFSTTLNALSANQPIWVRVAARSNCRIGTYGTATLVGGPGLPNTGLAPQKSDFTLYIAVGILPLLILIQRKYRFLSRH